jgi:predicted TPR repeat methyltransferase
MQQAVSHPVARPYSELAATYDATLGVPIFVGTRRAFEELVIRYGIDFRSAADIGCGTGLFARYLNRTLPWTDAGDAANSHEEL